MDSVVVHDSAYAAATALAQAVTAVLARHGSCRLIHAMHATSLASLRCDVLVVSSPTYRYRPTRRMRFLLGDLEPGSLAGRHAAAFDSRAQVANWKSGSAARVMARRLVSVGAKLVVAPESFFVEHVHGPLQEGELERAQRWAQRIATSVLAESL